MNITPIRKHCETCRHWDVSKIDLDPTHSGIGATCTSERSQSYMEITLPRYHCHAYQSIGESDD